MNKGQIRLLIKENIQAMTEEEKKRESAVVCKKIIEFLEGQNFEKIITYDPLSDEVDIRKVIIWAKQQGIEVITMEQTTELCPLNKGGQGGFNELKSVIIVPGRAFTQNGDRIGRGAGYFDQLLEKHPEFIRIGACFSCQIFEELPQDSWDQKMSQVVFVGNNLE